jgi:hypothetical protein
MTGDALHTIHGDHSLRHDQRGGHENPADETTQERLHNTTPHKVPESSHRRGWTRPLDLHMIA